MANPSKATGLECSEKERVKAFWEENPCGAGDVSFLEEGSREFFDAIERNRYEGGDFMPGLTRFDQWKGKRILEIGCGLGTDLLQFAKAGAEVFGIDLSEKSVALTQKRLGLHNLSGIVQVADGEKLSFSDDHFDLVYSWGVLHHTPSPESAAREMVRVCKRGGSVLAMVYNRYSLVALQVWIFYGLLRGKPWKSPSGLISKYMESPGTKTFTKGEARRLFKGLKSVRVRTVVTRYDLRLARRLFLPRWMRQLVPSEWGWFMVIEGTKS